MPYVYEAIIYEGFKKSKAPFITFNSLQTTKTMHLQVQIVLVPSEVSH